MIESILEEMGNRDLENHDELSLTEMKEDENNLTLTFKIQNDFDNKDLSQIWRVKCKDFMERKIEDNYFYSFELFEEHALLWEYTENRCQLFFRGYTENLEALVGSLFLKHKEITEGWIPFDKYLNDMTEIEKLLQWGAGLLAEGPEKIVNEYSKVLDSFNINSSIVSIGYPKKWCENGLIEDKDEKYVLIFGNSFVVAREFIDERIL